MTKRCVGCMKYKDERMFYESSRSEDGLNRYCKQCCKVNRALEAIRKRDRKVKISFRQCYRAKIAGIDYDETITLEAVFKKHFGECAFCGEWVKPRHASIDHTTPISKGGTHTWGNVQLMHLICNLRKGNREEEC